MQSRNAVLLFGLLLSAGPVFAQASTAGQQQPAAQPQTAQPNRPAGARRSPLAGRAAQDLNLTPEQKEQIKAIRQEAQSKVTSVLTDQQKQELQQIKAAPGSLVLARRLNLTQDQEEQLRPILVERRQQMQALRANTSLSAQDRRAQATTIQQDAKAMIEALLNNQQKLQFERMLAARKTLAQRRRQTQPGV